MFQESLVESTPLLRTGNRWPFIASIATQAALVAVLVAVPLLHPELLPAHAPKLSSLAAPMTPPPPPPPPAQLLRVIPTAPTATPAAPATSAPLIRPIIISTAPGVDTPLFPTSPSMGPTNPTIPIGIGPSGAGGPVHVSVAPAPATPALLHVSTGVALGLLLAPIAPIYPQIAKVTHTQGTVVVQAIISKSGHIENPHVVSGPIMLQNAALEAVRNARYRPYLLNNQPTEVETTISINFRMNN